MHRKGYVSQKVANQRLRLIQSGKACKIEWIKEDIDTVWKKANLPE